MFCGRSARRWSKKARKPPPEWFSKSLDRFNSEIIIMILLDEECDGDQVIFNRCVEEKDPECLVGSGAQDLQLTYFCGSKYWIVQIMSIKSSSLYKRRAPLKIVFDIFPQHRMRRPKKQDSTAAGNVQP